MTWEVWLLIGWFSLVALMTVAVVGKRREPISGTTAVITLALEGGLAWLVLRVAGVL